MSNRALEMAERFDIPQGARECAPYGNGHINSTYCLVVTGEDGARRRFILQKVNRYVFREPERMMGNIQRVTEYLRGEIAREGGDPDRETLTLVPTRDGDQWTIDPDGELWRMYLFVEDTISYDLPDTPELFEKSGAAFGRFQRQLGGFDAATLFETIPDFHNTPARFRQLEDAIARNEAGRLNDVAEEIAFCMARKAETSVLLDALAAGEIPLRVTHNDTKLNNVLLDARTGDGACVIDLDTVMPGLSAYDFGDSIRTGANTAAEDETDLEKVQFSLEMFEAYARGFLREAGKRFTPREIELLPMGAKLMTFECGMRFLADYLNGDKYFRVHREGHNLDRARAQFTLVKRMEDCWEDMMAVIHRM